MITLNANYKRNIAILKENLKRGLKEEQAEKIIDNFEDQFIQASLYKEEEKQFIDEMRKLLNQKTVSVQQLASSMGIQFNQL